MAAKRDRFGRFLPKTGEPAWANTAPRRVKGKFARGTLEGSTRSTRAKTRSVPQKRDRYGRMLPKDGSTPAWANVKPRRVKGKFAGGGLRGSQRSQRDFERAVVELEAERRKTAQLEMDLQEARQLAQSASRREVDLDALRAAYPDVSQDELIQLAVLQMKATNKTPGDTRKNGQELSAYLSGWDWETYYEDADEWTDHDIYELYYYGETS